MAQDTKIAIGVSMVAVLILVSAFMPWGTINSSPHFQMPFENGNPLGANFSQNMKMTVAVTCWDGSFTLGGIELPNWLAVLAAAAVAALCWLKVAAVWDAPAAVPVALAFYGLIHTGAIFITMIFAEGCNAGVGAFLTILAFIGMLAILFRTSKARVCCTEEW